MVALPAAVVACDAAAGMAAADVLAACEASTVAGAAAAVVSAAAEEAAGGKSGETNAVALQGSRDWQRGSWCSGGGLGGHLWTIQLQEHTLRQRHTY